MAALPNPKHELFAQARANGSTVDEAYQQAGFRAHRGNAHRLSTNESVKRRVTELQGRAAEKAEWTAADRLKMLSDIAQAAAEKDPRVAVSAIAEANKMQGSHAPSKHQHAGPGGGPIPTVDLTNLSPDDLNRLEALFGPLAGAAGNDAEDDQAGEGEAGG